MKFWIMSFLLFIALGAMIYGTASNKSFFYYGGIVLFVSTFVCDHRKKARIGK